MIIIETIIQAYDQMEKKVSFSEIQSQSLLRNQHLHQRQDTRTTTSVYGTGIAKSTTETVQTRNHEIEGERSSLPSTLTGSIPEVKSAKVNILCFLPSSAIYSLVIFLHSLLPNRQAGGNSIFWQRCSIVFFSSTKLLRSINMNE